MRESKFRAWEKKLKFMMPIKEIDFDKEIANKSGVWRMLSEVELMQYTGLKDKYGVEIYEGDILNYGDYLQSHEVIFKNGCFWGHAIGCGENIGIGLYHALEDLEIAGNIYDNPELMEVAK